MGGGRLRRRPQAPPAPKRVSEEACSSQPARQAELDPRRGGPRMHSVTSRFCGKWQAYEPQLQRSRWSSSIVEICICGMLAPSFVAAYDADPNTAIFHWTYFFLKILWAAVALSRRFCMCRDPLFGKRLFEWVVGATVVLGVCVHAVSDTKAPDQLLPQVRDKVFRFRYGPMAHSMMAIVAGTLCHVLHLHPVVKLLLGLSITLCTVIRPVFPFGPVPEIKFVGVATLAGYLFGYALEWQLRENFITQKVSRDAVAAQRRADSRLNHVVKGLCGGASGLLLGLKVQLEQNGHSACTSEALDEVRRMLDEASEWVHKRQFFMQLEAGEYTSRAVRTNLRAKMEQLVALDGCFEGVGEVCVDINVLLLVTQEALSNARKYRDRHTPIRITARVADAEDRPHATLLLTISSTNDAWVPRLSEDECKTVFKAGVKANSLSSTSDGLGLDNASVAIKAAHGRVWLTTTTDASGDHTHMHCELPVSEWPPSPSLRASACEHLILGKEQQAARPDATMQSAERGQDSGSASLLDAPVPVVVPDGRCCLGSPASATPTRPALVCIGLDDTLMLRKMHMLLFKLFVGADMERSGSMGATRDEITGFIDVVMGRCDLQMRPVDWPPADVAVLDQNLCDEKGDVVIHGEEIAQRLRDDGFTGVTCLLTGSNEDEIGRLSQLPQVDLAFGKSADLRVLAKHILEKARPSA